MWSKIIVCFYKRKTAYEVRISVLSSDVCSSDLRALRWSAAAGGRRPCSGQPARVALRRRADGQPRLPSPHRGAAPPARGRRPLRPDPREDRTRVASGKSVSVRVDHGGRRSITKKNPNKQNNIYYNHNHPT